MRLSAARFNAHLSGPVGQTFAWRKRSACPCVSPDSGSARYDCPLCNSKGHIWAAEVTPCPAGMPNQSPQKAMAMFGDYAPGDASLAVPASSPMYAAGQWDRIRSLNSTNPFSIVIVANRNDKLMGSIVSVDRVFWLDDDGEAIVEGDIPAVGNDGALTWADGDDAPPEGRNFTVEGVRYDEWFVFRDLAADRNAGVSGLPRRLPVRRLDLLAR